MSFAETKTMRDALIDNIYKKMQENNRIFFLSALPAIFYNYGFKSISLAVGLINSK